MATADSSSDDSDIPKKKRYLSSSKPKVFQNSWTRDNNYNKWLEPIQSNNCKCKCKVCDVILNCGKSELDKHRQGLKHSQIMKTIDKTPKMTEFLKVNDPLEDQIKAAEVIISAFYAELNVAFETIDHLIPALKICFHSKILQQVKLGRTKVTEMVKNVLAKHETSKLISTLRSVRFSILIDESTDISDEKLLCVLVRYVENLNASDCSAIKALKNCFVTKGIPMENMIGVASDGAAVMVGKHNSLFSKVFFVYRL